MTGGALKRRDSFYQLIQGTDVQPAACREELQYSINSTQVKMSWLLSSSKGSLVVADGKFDGKDWDMTLVHWFQIVVDF